MAHQNYRNAMISAITLCGLCGLGGFSWHARQLQRTSGIESPIATLVASNLTNTSYLGGTSIASQMLNTTEHVYIVAEAELQSRPLTTQRTVMHTSLSSSTASMIAMAGYLIPMIRQISRLSLAIIVTMMAVVWNIWYLSRRCKAKDRTIQGLAKSMIDRDRGYDQKLLAVKETADRELSQKNQEMAALERDRAVHKEVVETYNTQTLANNEAITQLHKENDSLKTQKKQVMEQCEELERVKCKAQEQLEEKRKHDVISSPELAAMQVKNDSLQTRLAKVIEEKNRIAREKDDIAREFEKYDEDNVLYVDAQNARIKQLENGSGSQHQDSERVLTSLRREIDELQQERNTARDDLDTAKESNEKTESKVTVLKQTIETLEGVRGELEQSKEKLDARIEHLESTETEMVLTLKTELTELKQSINTAAIEAENLTNTNRSLRDEITTLTNEKARLTRQEAELKRSKLSNGERITELEQACKDLTAAIEIAESTSKTAHQLEVDELKREYASLAANLQEEKDNSATIKRNFRKNHERIVRETNAEWQRKVDQAASEAQHKAVPEVVDVIPEHDHMDVVNDTGVLNTHVCQLESALYRAQIETQSAQDKLKNQENITQHQGAALSQTQQLLAEMEEKLKEVEENRRNCQLDLDGEVECLKHANEEVAKLQKSAASLQKELKKTKSNLRLAKREHSATEVFGLMRDAQRARELLDEVAQTQYDQDQCYMLDKLNDCNGAIRLVILQLQDPDYKFDEASLLSTLRKGVMNEEDIENIDPKITPVLKLQAKKANERLRLLQKQLVGYDPGSIVKSMHAKALLPRGDGDDFESPEKPCPATYANKRRNVSVPDEDMEPGNTSTSTSQSEQTAILSNADMLPPVQPTPIFDLPTPIPGLFAPLGQSTKSGFHITNVSPNYNAGDDHTQQSFAVDESDSETNVPTLATQLGRTIRTPCSRRSARLTKDEGPPRLYAPELILNNHPLFRSGVQDAAAPSSTDPQPSTRENSVDKQHGGVGFGPLNFRDHRYQNGGQGGDGQSSENVDPFSFTSVTPSQFNGAIMNLREKMEHEGWILPSFSLQDNVDPALAEEDGAYGTIATDNDESLSVPADWNQPGFFEDDGSFANNILADPAVAEEDGAYDTIATDNDEPLSVPADWNQPGFFEDDGSFANNILADDCDDIYAEAC